MADIATNFQQAWHDTWYILAQQKTSRFYQYVRKDGEVVGKWAWFKRMGSVEMQERTSRHQDTALVEIPHSRRGCALRDYELADLIDPQDLHRVNDPTAPMLNTLRFAARRRTDRTILAAVNGTAVSADEDDAQTNNSLPSAQKVAGGSTGMTLQKLRDARRILATSEIFDPEQMPVLPCALSSEEMDDLLGITQLTSIEYGDKSLQKGRVMRGMGFEFIETTLLGNDGTNRLCLAWVPGAIGYREPDGELKTDIGPRRDKGGSIQLLGQKTNGSVRIEDVGVVEIACVL
jgi:hypothetical protein